MSFDNTPNKHSSWLRRLQDALIKTNIFPFFIRRRLQNVLIKTNIIVFFRCLHDILPGFLEYDFKTSSRLLAKMYSRHLQDVFKTFPRWLQDVFNAFSRRTARMIIYRKICLGHTSEKFMIRVQIFKFPIFQLSIFQSEQFFKTLYEVTTTAIKIFLLKSGIIKDINKEKESVNKSSSKNVFLRF